MEGSRIETVQVIRQEIWEVFAEDAYCSDAEKGGGGEAGRGVGEGEGGGESRRWGKGREKGERTQGRKSGRGRELKVTRLRYRSVKMTAKTRLLSHVDWAK